MNNLENMLTLIMEENLLVKMILRLKSLFECKILRLSAAAETNFMSKAFVDKHFYV